MTQNTKNHEMQAYRDTPNGSTRFYRWIVNQYKPSVLVRGLMAMLFILLGGLGTVLTLPLLLLGGGVGVLVGFLIREALLEAGLFGATIGSLGSLFFIRLGIELWTTPIYSPLDLSQAHKNEIEEPMDENESDLSKPIVVPEPQLPKIKHSPYRTTDAVDFNDVEEVNAFIKKVRVVVEQLEATAELKPTSNLSNVKEPFLLKLISIIKDLTVEHDFWGRMEQMTDHDVRTFVGKLSTDNKGHKFNSSELDLLWRRFKGSEFEPTRKEHKMKKFKVILEALSSDQLKSSFQSPEFLSVLQQNEYIDVAVNTLSSTQLALFAENFERHTLLNKMIKKLKPEIFTLGRIVAILPFATAELKVNLLEQISHLPQSVSFKNELAGLAEYYIKLNTQRQSTSIQRSNTLPTLKKEPKAPSKWATIPARTSPIYAPTQLAKIEPWTDQTFEQFITQLNDKSYLIHEKKLAEDIGLIPDDRLKKMVEISRAPQFTGLLDHYWVMESKPNNHNSYIIGRKHRLKTVLENLTEEQLKNAVKNEKFWDIFKNTQQPHCKMAAKVLTPEQFRTIIANAPLQRHCDFATLLLHIKKDTAKDKVRLIKIIKEVLPYTSPWFVLALELKIKDLLGFDKGLFNEFHHLLRIHLSEALQHEEVNLKYTLDRTLNKKAISILLIHSKELFNEESMNVTI